MDENNGSRDFYLSDKREPSGSAQLIARKEIEIEFTIGEGL